MRMVRLSVDEMKLVEVNILDAVVDFCKKNNIRYFLCGGTLLGAVRHQGFIPWDDDIDILMPRPDYERFCSLFPNQNSRYVVKNLTLSKEFYPIFFSKVIDTQTVIEETNVRTVSGIGVNIDVFPMDGLGNNKTMAEKKMMRARFLFSCLYACGIKYKKVTGIYTLIRNVIVWTLNSAKIILFKYYDSMAKSIDYHESKYIGVLTGTYGKGEVQDAEWYKDEIAVLFEGKYYSAPKGYHDYLSGIFGDYMQLPPEEKRVAPHGLVAYRIDN